MYGRAGSRNFAIPSFCLACFLSGCLAGTGGKESGGEGGNSAPSPEPLLLQSVDPSNEAVGILPEAVVEARFSRPPDPAAVDRESFALLDGAGSAVEGSIEPVEEEPGKTSALYRLTPFAPLKTPECEYRIRFDEKRIRTSDGAALDLSRSPAGSTFRFFTRKEIDDDPPYFFFFERTAAAESPTAIRLTWWPAIDPPGGTPQDRLRYAVYGGRDPGGIDFSKAAVLSEPGATSLRIEELEPDAAYSFVIRARDEAGNEDGNREVLSARTWPQDLTIIYTGDVCAFLEPCG